MPPAASPCIGLCTIDAASALCLGCGRTLDEIVAWGGMTEPQRLAVLAALDSRRPADRRRAVDADGIDA